VVGSAIVRMIEAKGAAPELASEVGAFIRALKRAMSNEQRVTRPAMSRLRTSYAYSGERSASWQGAPTQEYRGYSESAGRQALEGRRIGA
jgi:hypothetical protein